VATDLKRIGEKARKEPDLVFNNLYHHIYDTDNLRACYDSLRAGKATGVDGVTKEEYGKNLEENLRELSGRLRRMGYRPKPKRRSYIPKPGSQKGRPLGISSFEDKIVEESVKRTLEPIYEAVFEESSYGYRPKRNPHQCLDTLGKTIQQRRITQVVEADIKRFFDEVNQAWMVKFLRHRIGDERVIRLIIRMLKSGILEEGLVRASEQGTPQGSIVSPLLSNIYLHYVLDLWFNRRVRKQCQGEAYYFRFADDFLACFQYEEDAERFLQRLRGRLEKFGLHLAEEKTQRIEFGRYARQDAYKRGRKPKEFTFLGFTHYCGKTKHQPEKAGAEPTRVHGLGRESQTRTEKRGNAPAGTDTCAGIPELLRHNGQPGTVPLLCLSHTTNPVQMAQPQEPAKGIHLGSVHSSLGLGELAHPQDPQRPEPVS
jgi:group II intron reverse transcriptase/maturase